MIKEWEIVEVKTHNPDNKDEKLQIFTAEFGLADTFFEIAFHDNGFIERCSKRYRDDDATELSKFDATELQQLARLIKKEIANRVKRKKQ